MSASELCTLPRIEASHEIKEEIVSMEPVIEKTRSRLDEWPLMDRKTASKCELDAGAGSGWNKRL
jgi:hypothetical protein